MLSKELDHDCDFNPSMENLRESGAESFGSDLKMLIRKAEGERQESGGRRKDAAPGSAKI